LNRPNYPTFIDLEFRSSQGTRASTSWDFRCWSEIRSPNIDADFTLAGARTRNAVILAGQAIKVPFGGISDIPGPVTLLGLVPTDEDSGRWTLDRPISSIDLTAANRRRFSSRPSDAPPGGTAPRRRLLRPVAVRCRPSDGDLNRAGRVRKIGLASRTLDPRLEP
jgi:hypothetical protein